MVRTLDITWLPQTQRVGSESSTVNLAAMVHLLRPTIEEFARLHVIKRSLSFGFAMAPPGRAWQHWHTWNDPYQLTWFGTGWGHDRDRYVANAIRKMRAAQRVQADSLTIRDSPEGTPFGRFSDPVQSVEEDGSFAWGDFPHGGAVFVNFGDYQLLGAVSALAPEEDHAVAAMILNVIGLQLRKVGYEID